MALGEILRKARLAKKETTSQVAAATQMKVQMVEGIEHEDFRGVAAPIYGKGFIKMYAKHVGLDPKPLVDEYVERFVSPSVPSSVRQPGAMDDDILEMPPQETPSHPAPAASPGKLPEEADLFARAEKLRVERRRAAPEQVAPPEPLIDFDKLWSKAKTGVSDFSRTASRLVGRGTESLRGRLKDVSASWPKPEFRFPRFQMPRFQMPSLSLVDAPVKTVSIGIVILTLAIFLISGLSRCSREPDVEVTTPDNGADRPLRIAVEPPPPYFD